MTCDLYWNTHKHTFSIRQKGKVVGYTEEAIVLGPKFIVSDAGRKRVLREGVKNIHAFIRGSVVNKYDNYYKKYKNSFLWDNRTESDYSFVVYDPYDPVGLFRVLCVVGDIPITQKFNGCIKMAYIFVNQGRPQVKVKMS